MALSRTFLPVAAFSLLSGAALAEGHDQIRAAQDAWEASFNTGSAEAAASNYTETAKLMPPGRDLYDGREAVKAFWGAVLDAGVHSLELDVIEVEVLGDTAIEVGTWAAIRVDENGADVPIHGNSLVIWKRGEDGTWLMSHDIYNYNP